MTDSISALAALLLSSGGAISGVVHLAHPPPAAPPLPVTQDHRACGVDAPDESLVVDAGGGVANAIVFLESSGVTQPAGNATEASLVEHRSAAKSADVTLDQKHCRFAPHVLAAQVGATLSAINSDPVLHTVHGTGPDKRFAFDEAMPFKGARRAIALDRTGLFELTCDAGHPWMHAWLRVFKHPYFSVTDAHGHFALPAVPPGNYSVAVWQEKLGERHLNVTVGEHGAAPLTIELSPEKP